MSEPIRLVIWDLDETFWKGTFSEGGIAEYVQEHHEIVVELARRGIMSSICSKNDFEPVRQFLTEKGIWDYFIFPNISWESKGHRIRAIIEATQLRPEAVLFIDDNHGNRAEALTAIQGLRVGDEATIRTLLEDPLLEGRDDSGLARLSQYKILERRAAERAAQKVDNKAFLRQSRIVVEIEYNILRHADRAVELINRTNQLNFTRARLPADNKEAVRQLQQQVDHFDARAGLVKVTDKYGHYGICGFFLVRGHWGRLQLQHFVFSCRVLGMGVEQWVYNRLGRPSLAEIGVVPSELLLDPDWINAAPKNHRHGQCEAKVVHRTTEPINVRIRGGCELEVLEHFFRMSGSEVCSEVVYQAGLHTICNNHSVLLHQFATGVATKVAHVLGAIGLSLADVSSRFLAPCDDGTLLIFSNSADAFVDAYRHKSLDLILPIAFSGFGRVTRRAKLEVEDYFRRQNMTELEKHEFYRIQHYIENEFKMLDRDDSNNLMKEVYRDIMKQVPENALLIVVLPNPTMVTVNGSKAENELQRKLNDQMRETATSVQNVKILDTASILLDVSEVKGWYHHFERPVYYRMYQALCDLYNSWIM